MAWKECCLTCDSHVVELSVGDRGGVLQSVLPGSVDRSQHFLVHILPRRTHHVQHKLGRIPHYGPVDVHCGHLKPTKSNCNTNSNTNGRTLKQLDSLSSPPSPPTCPGIFVHIFRLLYFKKCAARERKKSQ